MSSSCPESSKSRDSIRISDSGNATTGIKAKVVPSDIHANQNSPNIFSTELRQQFVLLDQLSDAVIIRDLEDRICFWSKGAENLYGWQAREVTGRNFYDVLVGEQSA